MRKTNPVVIKDHIKNKYFAKLNKVSTMDAWTLQLPPNNFKSLKETTYIYNFDDGVFQIFNDNVKLFEYKMKKYICIAVMTQHVTSVVTDRGIDISLVKHYVDDKQMRSTESVNGLTKSELDRFMKLAENVNKKQFDKLTKDEHDVLTVFWEKMSNEEI